MNEKLIELFHPRRFRTSGLMHAFLQQILGTDWVTPRLGSISITSDGFLICGGNFYGAASDLERNLTGCAEAAGLDENETAHLFDLYRSAITDWRNY